MPTNLLVWYEAPEKIKGAEPLMKRSYKDEEESGISLSFGRITVLPFMSLEIRLASKSEHVLLFSLTKTTSLFWLSGISLPVSQDMMNSFCLFAR